MGQGFYTAVVYGAVLKDDAVQLLDHPLVEQWYLGGIREDEHNSLKICSRYEAQDAWIGFMVADSDGNINTRFRPDQDDYHQQRGLLMHYRAFKLTDLEDQIESAEPGIMTRVKAAWTLFAQEVQDTGVDLPEAALLLVNDWH